MVVPNSQNDFARNVYCVLGVPVDNITMDDLVSGIIASAGARQRYFISTPNLNYLMLSQRSLEFRLSLLQSDVCAADGVGVLFVCGLLGIPINARVAGSDLPTAIASSPRKMTSRPLSLALVGGEPGVGELARDAINVLKSDSIICTGAIDPGAIDLDNLGNSRTIDSINATRADFLLVALGAQKGQAWLVRNLEVLDIPVVSHLGATLDFLAGTVRRAPTTIRKLGLEWLWRIKEQPRLFSRYFSDGRQLVWALFGRILPLAVWLLWHKKFDAGQPPHVEAVDEEFDGVRIVLGGTLVDDRLAAVSETFNRVAKKYGPITLDMECVSFFEMGLAGQILMLEKIAYKQKRLLKIIGAANSTSRALEWCGLKHLIYNGEKA